MGTIIRLIAKEKNPVFGIATSGGMISEHLHFLFPFSQWVPFSSLICLRGQNILSAVYVHFIVFAVALDHIKSY